MKLKKKNVPVMRLDVVVEQRYPCFAPRPRSISGPNTHVDVPVRLERQKRREYTDAPNHRRADHSHETPSGVCIGGSVHRFEANVARVDDSVRPGSSGESEPNDAGLVSPREQVIQPSQG